MLPTDAQTLKERLAELAEVFERKPVTEKALRVWFDVLREFPIERVAGILLGWPKVHTKFPAPAEVWKAADAARESASHRLASGAETFHPGVGGAQAEHFLAQMREVLKRPKWTPREHWERVLAKSAKGSIGERFAEEALKKLGKRAAREPGEDDEELAA